MKPIPLKKYRKFLKAQGLYHKRTESSHEIWDMIDNSLPRPITVDSNYNEVPLLHIRNTLRLLNMTSKEFEKEISKI